ncbi:MULTISPECIES: hypothetical protein [unclassified Sphingomonas]|uniref:hypothetical protein n=1 Tax=unclassified Sphingomonas TaxID=196159 RepID=UPI0006F8C488|nr:MULTISPECIES: hypothetical protein [unclassified Sphingomonas]KQM62176.1 hypothetical protein ASE65_03950 [Sphingomonas sp. Leaf16]KQN13580.1 hypothetical protein ASE81_04020 [Sphingomonas sp. Leaf29]KQN23187.1 hypothetical protein ASE83_01390 [Sphingomonas sp. Leaf32]
MTAGGWQARALSWVLAMVGAVATMSTNGGSSPSGANTGTDATERVDPRTGQPLLPPAPFTTGAPRIETAESIATAKQAAATRSVADWLAVLTYAVLALVAVLAVGVLALFRIAQALAERRD